MKVERKQRARKERKNERRELCADDIKYNAIMLNRVRMHVNAKARKILLDLSSTIGSRTIEERIERFFTRGVSRALLAVLLRPNEQSRANANWQNVFRIQGAGRFPRALIAVGRGLN